MSVFNGPISRIMPIVGCSINRIKNRGDHVHVLVLYGLGVDTVNQSFFVPTEKVVELQEHIMRVQDKKKNYSQTTPVSGWFTKALPA